jgi:selenocysteine-specific elongation factor
VLDASPPHRRRSDPALLRDLEALLRREADADVLVRVRRAGLAGVERAALALETGRADAEIARALAEPDAEVVEAGGRVVSTEALARLEGALVDALDAYHRAEPLRPGMPAGALRGALPDNVPREVAERALAALVARTEIATEGDHVRRASHRPTLDAATLEVGERIAQWLAEVGLEAPALRDVAERMGVVEAPLRDLLAHLEREGRIVRAPGDLWFDARAVEALRERVRRHFDASDALDTKTYKALIGTTRRTAVPLMELLDAERLTVRRGEVRRLRVGARSS